MGVLLHQARALLSLGLLLTAAEAAANPPKPVPENVFDTDLRGKPSEPQWKREQRRDLAFQEGKKLIEEESWSKAAQKLREVIDIRSDPRALLWLGFAQEKQGNLLNAKAIYAQALQDARDEKRTQEEEDAKQALAALAPAIPRLDIHLPAGVESSVYVDAALMNLQKGGVEVDPGSHSLTIVSPGRQTFHMRTDVKAGQAVAIEPALLEISPTPLPADLPPVQPVDPGPRGCSCEVPTERGGNLAGWAVAAGVALLWIFRRTRSAGAPR